MKYILSLLVLLFGSCSMMEEECNNPSLPKEEGPIQFRATVGRADGGNVPGYESTYFEEGDQIRIYCPVSYSTPNFEDGAEGTYIYTYSTTKENPDWSNWPYVFLPQGIGFDWRTLQPTSIYYMFEALHFPGGAFMKEVPYEQNKDVTLQTNEETSVTLSGLERADMLIAYNRSPLRDRGNTVQLTFYHAFAMVEVKVKMPVSQTAADGPFPENALKGVYMNDVLTAYEVNYSEVIDDDGLRTVRAVGDDGGAADRKDVWMKQLSDDLVADGKYQEYVYQGIVPAQKFKEDGKDFIHFKVKRHDSTEEVLYKFVPNQSMADLSLETAKVLVLTLTISDDGHEVLLATAEVKPWGEAQADMDIFPKPNNN